MESAKEIKKFNELKLVIMIILKIFASVCKGSLLSDMTAVHTYEKSGAWNLAALP